MSATINSTSSTSHSQLGPHDWDSWREHLATRQRPHRLSELFTSSDNSPLNWALPADLEKSSVEPLVTHWNRSFSQKTPPTQAATKKAKQGKSEPPKDLSWVDELESWLSSVAKSQTSDRFAYQCLAWCHLLPQLANQLPAAPWTELLETMVDIAEGSQQLSPFERPLQHTLLAGELGLTLVYLFPELESCQRLADSSDSALSTGLIELLDGEGLPHVSDLPVFRALIASWTRCELISAALDKDCFSRDARAQFEWAVRQAICLTRQDQSQLFTTATGAEAWDLCCEAALQAAGDEVDWILASQSILNSKQKSAHRHKYQHLDQKTLAAPVIHSAWSEFTVMRNSGRKSAHRLAIGYDQPTMSTELMQRGHTLWQGDWATSISIDGTPVAFDHEWDVTCWFSDDDGDYLELETDLGSDRRLQRQILLGRKDQFLFQADVILGNQASQIDYQTRLPLTSEASFQEADQTHEGVVASAGHNALVLPLACPEWRSESSPGRLQQIDGTLQYQIEVTARNLYAPLFIDLSRAGTEKPYTWRRLTVAELFDIQSPDVAVGYRIQVGSRQWCLYRSLDPATNRSFLGQNLTSEFIFGRFNRNGKLKEILEIE